MTAPAAPAVALPEAVRDALDAYAEAAYRLGYDCGRDAGRDIEDAGRVATSEAWATAGAAITAAIAQAEARGREAALAEVDAAVERIGDHGDVTLRAEGGGWTLFQDRDVIEGRTTPTAAILAAARALDEGEGRRP